MAGDLAALLSFIKQAPAQAQPVDIRSLMIQPPREDPVAFARKQYNDQLEYARQAAQQAPALFGSAPMVKREAYQLSPNEQFEEGEQIPGLENEVQAPGTGLYDDSKSQQQRLYEFNQRMLASGNPLLQKQALANINSMQSSIMTGVNQMGDLTTDQKNYRYGQIDPRFNAWLVGVKRAGASNVNVGGAEYLSPSEASQLRYLDGRPVAPFTPKESLVGQVRAVTAAEQKEGMQSQKSLAMVDEMDTMLFGENGIYSPFVAEDGSINEMDWMQRGKAIFEGNVQQYAQTDPRYKAYKSWADGTLAPFAKSLGQAGSLSDKDLELVENLVPTLTGINPDTPQVAKEKLNKLRRLIKVGLENGGLITEADIMSVTGRKYKVGDIIPGDDGSYKFLGGNPAKKDNWEKVNG